LAAAVAVWNSTLEANNTLMIDLATSNTFGAWSNDVWINSYGPFVPNYKTDRTTYNEFLGYIPFNIHWQYKLVTMLHGYNYSDAQKLLDSALLAESIQPTPATDDAVFVMMIGGDSARQALDYEFPSVNATLNGAGFKATVIPFDSTLQFSQRIGSFVIGTASLGNTIENNTYAPWALVDNLTSYGAVTGNFVVGGNNQVSIARWVSQGVCGAHGTTDEPYSNAFPDRTFLVDWSIGWTLGESYHGRMPFVLWKNLVLGDVMAAPFTKRPTLSVLSGQAGSTICSDCLFQVQATAYRGNRISSMSLLVNGVFIKTINATNNSTTMTFGITGLPASNVPVQVLVVAQYALVPYSKGWISFNATVVPMASQTYVNSQSSSSANLGSNAQSNSRPTVKSNAVTLYFNYFCFIALFILLSQ